MLDVEGVRTSRRLVFRAVSDRALRFFQQNFDRAEIEVDVGRARNVSRFVECERLRVEVTVTSRNEG